MIISNNNNNNNNNNNTNKKNNNPGQQIQICYLLNVSDKKIKFMPLSMGQ